jgi:transposase
VRWGNPAEPGLRVWVTDHRYAEVSCPCGHHTRAAPAQGEAAWEGTALREWRLVGPGLATLIVARHLRFRMSRRLREFLGEWLGVQLSIGTLHQTLQEAAAATAPAEQEMIEAVQASGLLHADETAWPQQDADRLRWRWVFVGIQVVYYAVADRGKATVRRVMAGFDGWLMSDGWFSYREYPKRLSGWAHLLRKAKGLRDSCTPDARVFGQRVHDTLQHLMTAIYAAREGPPGTPSDLSATHADRLDALHRACRLRLGHTHEKTKALALEFYNDWEAIFQVLKHPALPLTNNEAERILRHWVIHRRISGGTRTSVGSRGFALLASVIDTCRLRGHSPWRYLAAGLADRRAGRPLASLPQAGV